ncbi:MAG: hypothetical protein PHY93_14845 [Bacteriovorax sp.]|nr:hypothetical protein [Bacteriovorax sp.]
MKKSLFVFLFAILGLTSTVSIAADSKAVLAVDPVPVVEAVPAPVVVPDEVPATKIKSPKDVIEDTKIGLIKTEKIYVDKSCHMVKGKLNCKPKKAKRKTIDSAPDPDLKDVKENNTP